MKQKQSSDHIGDANKKVTAVEWLLSFMLKPLSQWPDDMWEQAKAMEKEQIIDAYATAVMNENNSDYIGMNEQTSGEIYYEETFNTKDK